MNLITLHLGARLPKAYEPSTAGPGGTAKLAAQQPAPLKHRIKLRFDPATPPRIMAQEAAIQWRIHTLDEVPAWIAGTDEKAVQVLALMLGINEVRPWDPAEGDA